MTTRTQIIEGLGILADGISAVVDKLKTSPPPPDSPPSDEGAFLDAIATRIGDMIAEVDTALGRHPPVITPPAPSGNPTAAGVSSSGVICPVCGRTFDTATQTTTCPHPKF